MLDGNELGDADGLILKRLDSPIGTELGAAVGNDDGAGLADGASLGWT